MSLSVIPSSTSTHFKRKKSSHVIWCDRCLAFEWRKRCPSRWKISSIGLSSGEYGGRFNMKILFSQRISDSTWFSSVTCILALSHINIWPGCRNPVTKSCVIKWLNAVDVPLYFPNWYAILEFPSYLDFNHTWLRVPIENQYWARSIPNLKHVFYHVRQNR